MAAIELPAGILPAEPTPTKKGENQMRDDMQVLFSGLDSIANRRAEQRAAQERRDRLRVEIEAQEKKNAADRDIRERIAMLQIERADRDREAKMIEAKGKLEADAIRRFGKTWDQFGDFVRKESDPVTRLNRAKAQRELDSMGGLPPANSNATLADDVQRLELKKKKETLTAPPAPVAPPMAKVTQAFGADGKSRAQFDVPLDDFKKTARAASYRSPYADDIADLGRKIAEQQAEQDGGDNRTGFLNLTSRKSVIADATRKQRRLQALELQEMLAQGVIDQAEADRRAGIILGGTAK